MCNHLTEQIQLQPKHYTMLSFITSFHKWDDIFQSEIVKEDQWMKKFKYQVKVREHESRRIVERQMDLEK